MRAETSLQNALERFRSPLGLAATEPRGAGGVDAPRGSWPPSRWSRSRSWSARAQQSRLDLAREPATRWTTRARTRVPGPPEPAPAARPQPRPARSTASGPSFGSAWQPGRPPRSPSSCHELLSARALGARRPNRAVAELKVDVAPRTLRQRAAGDRGRGALGARASSSGWRKSIELQKKAVDIAEQQRQLATLRYQRGLASNFDVVDAEGSLVRGPQRAGRPADQPPGRALRAAARDRRPRRRRGSSCDEHAGGAARGAGRAGPGRRLGASRPRARGGGRGRGPGCAARAGRRRAGGACVMAVRAHPGRAVAALGVAGLVAVRGARRLCAAECPDGVAVAEAREGPFHLTIVEAGTLQALRSVTYASAIQSNQAKIVAMVPEGKLVAEGRPAAALRRRALRGGDPPLPGAALPGPGRPRQGAAGPQAPGDPEPGGAGGRAPEGRAQPARAGRRAAGQGPRARGGGGGRGLQRRARAGQGDRRARGPEAAPRPRASSPSRSWTAREQAVARAREDLALAQRPPRLAGELRPAAGAVAGQGRRRRSPGRARGSWRRRPPTGWSRSARRSRPRRAASRRRPASWRWPSSSSRAPRCGPTCPGIVVYRDVFFGSEQRKPQVGDQVWANQPLLILPDISKMVVETKVRETDIHKIEQNQKVVGARAGLPGPEAHRPGHPRGHPRPGGEGAPRHEVLRRHRAARRVGAAAAARG